MAEATKAYKKVHSTIPADLSRSSSLLEDSTSSGDSESQASRSQVNMATRSDSQSVVIQVDDLNAKGQSIVQHVSGDSREATQLSDMAKDKRVNPQEEFAMDTVPRSATREVVRVLPKPRRFGLKCPPSKKT